MYPLPATERKLFMHPAHRTIGVLGTESAAWRYRQANDLPPDDTESPPSGNEGLGPESDPGNHDPAC
jgi:hypothetical protein